MKRIKWWVALVMMAGMSVAEPVVEVIGLKSFRPWEKETILCKARGLSAIPYYYCFYGTNLVTKTPLKIASVQYDWPTNGVNQIQWDARADLGDVKLDKVQIRLTLQSAGGVQLWAGGPFWAPMNVGASKPGEYGYYFWWGDTVGYKRVGDKWVASDGSNNNFSFSEGNAPTYGLTDAQLASAGWTKNGVLAPAHDAATAHWGSGWRMPTQSELGELVRNCTTTWRSRNGVYGRLVTGKGSYASRSIFLPAVGYGNGTSLDRLGRYGYVWSSRMVSGHSNLAQILTFYSDSIGFRLFFYDRFYGYSVRPVARFTE